MKLGLVDDHAVMRKGLARLLESSSEMCVGFSVGSAREALSNLQESAVDVLIVDLSLPDVGGLSLVDTVKGRYPDMGLLVLSMHKAQRDILASLDAGADGYLHKSSNHQTLLQAIRTVARGESFLAPDVARMVLNTMRKRSQMEEVNLNERELAVLNLAAQGMTNPAIAKRLHLSESTVKLALRSGYRKLGAKSRAQAVAKASEMGILNYGKT